MSVVLLSFVGGENGELTTAISDAYGTVVEKLKDAQQASE
jgi:pilus assembly protein Flp/PilA